MITDLTLFMIGLAGLTYGAQWLVTGSSGIAARFGLSPAVIGLTIVAFGTSAPELLVSVVSSFKGKSMIAVGNIIGSNICNIALVLGLAALIRPIASNTAIVRQDIPIMIGVSLFLFFILINARISRFEGCILFTGIITYTWISYRKTIRDGRTANLEETALAQGSCFGQKKGALAGQGIWLVFCTLGGIGCVVAGAEALIRSSVSLMASFGVDEKFIGLTVVAFGTSLPELATSIAAVLKKQMDISVGNLVGSNMFNILSVLGAAAIVSPIKVPGGLVQSGMIVDYAIMLAVSVLVFLMMKKRAVVSRSSGLILLCCYFFYLTYLITGAVSG